MKTFALAAAILVLLPATAFAQTASPAPSTGGAAATLPNSFDGPPQAARTAVPAPAPTGPVAPRDPAIVAASEAALRTTIAALQRGAPNYTDMTPTLATRLRGLGTTITPLITGFGELKSIEYVGQEDEAELFVVLFDKAATQWIIGRDDAGKIAALLFRPVPTT